MRAVERGEIVDYQTYGEIRTEFRKQVMSAKSPRRIHVGDWFTFLFENPLTIRYQVQEMMLVERIVKESDIEHELRTYNALLGGDGELGCTLLIEIEDPTTRDQKLREWLSLPEHIYAVLEDKTRVRPVFDPKQRGEDRLSSVQYLKFPVGERPPAGLGVDLPQVSLEVLLSEEQREALAQDLSG